MAGVGGICKYLALVELFRGNEVWRLVVELLDLEVLVFVRVFGFDVFVYRIGLGFLKLHLVIGGGPAIHLLELGQLDPLVWKWKTFVCWKLYPRVRRLVALVRPGSPLDRMDLQSLVGEVVVRDELRGSGVVDGGSGRR